MNRNLFIRLFFFAALAVPYSLLSAQDIDAKNFYQGMKDWREKFGEYACAIQVEFLSERPEDPVGSDFWLICSYSKKLGLLRVDLKTIGDFSGAGFSPNYVAPVTTLTARDFVMQIQAGSLVKVDLTKDLKKKDLELLMDQPRLDPFMVPIIGWGAFYHSKVAPVPADPLLRLANEGKMVGEPVEVGRATQIKLLSFPKAKLYDTVTLDKKFGNLPVSLVRADESGKRIVEKIQTSWAVYKQAFLPKSVNILMYQRQKEGPAVPSQSWIAKYHWVFDAIPPSVFSNDSGSFMEPSNLLEFVLSHEASLEDLK